MKKCVDLITCDGCVRWVVFSEEECGFSLKEATNSKYKCGICKLGKMIETENKKSLVL